MKEDYNQKYPPYSSYRLNGKPLWEWAKLGKIDEVYHLVKSKKVSINSFKILGLEVKTGSELYEIVKNNINKLNDKEKESFRADSILKAWESKFSDNKCNYQIFDIEVDVSNGTFIRSICNDIGKMLDTCALAFDIERKKVNINK